MKIISIKMSLIDCFNSLYKIKYSFSLINSRHKDTSPKSIVDASKQLWVIWYCTSWFFLSILWWPLLDWLLFERRFLGRRLCGRRLLSARLCIGFWIEYKTAKLLKLDVTLKRQLRKLHEPTEIMNRVHFLFLIPYYLFYQIISIPYLPRIRNNNFYSLFAQNKE